MGDLCMVKDCENLQAAEVELVVPEGPVDAENYVLMDTRPFYVRVCLKHAREIAEGKTDVSFSVKGE